MTARMRPASVIRKLAFSAVSFRLLNCALQRLMKSCSFAHAFGLLLALTPLNASCSFASSPFFTPLSIGKACTAAIKSLICSAAPLTWIVNGQLFVSPPASIAWQVTALVPMAKVLPLGGLQLMLVTEQLSEAVGAKLTTAPAGELALATMSDGQSMAGGSESWTVTVKLQELLLPAASVTVQVTVVTPGAKGEPLDGLQLTLATERLSEAVGAKLTTANGQATMPGGQMMVGGVVSTTGAGASNAPMSVPSPPAAFTMAGSSKARRSRRHAGPSRSQ